MLRTILQDGDPLLRQRSLEVPAEEFGSEALLELIRDMWETMDHADGIGLAAPQIGVLNRIIIFGTPSNQCNDKLPTIPRTVLINPVLTIVFDDLIALPEGCLSVRDRTGEVLRYESVYYAGFDEFGEPVKGSADGWHARVLQHEYDHLDGILFTDHLKD